MKTKTFKERLSALQSEYVSLKESKRKLKRQVTSDLIKKKRAKCSELAWLSRRKSYRETHKKGKKDASTMAKNITKLQKTVKKTG